jgi:cytochrome c
MRAWIAALIALTVVGLAGCTGGKATPVYEPGTGGNTQAGKQVIQAYGCGACHTIPGIHSANGVVGPPLFFMARRTMIAGELPNTPGNLVRWIEDPPSVEPGTAMPKLGLSERDARDAAAYLYTLH